MYVNSNKNKDIFLFLGWYVVWKMFVCKFKFVQEILFNGESGGKTTGGAVPSETGSKRHRSKKHRIDD